MQNKAKLQKSQMNVNKVLTKDYEKKTLSERGKNKPKTNPNKAKTKPNKPKTKPKQIEDPEGSQTNRRSRGDPISKQTYSRLQRVDGLTYGVLWAIMRAIRLMSKAGWNQYGGPELLAPENHHGHGCNILFVDTHVDYVKKEDFGELMWKAGD